MTGDKEALNKAGRALLTALVLLAGLFLGLPARAQVAVEDIGFVALPGDQFQIELRFSARPPEPEVFLIENPPRLALDFPGVSNALEERQYPLEFDSADSVVVLEAQGRTRMVVNLNSPTAYDTRIQGNSLFVTVGEDGGATAAGAVLSAAAQAGAGAGAAASQGDIEGVDFRRGEGGAGEIVVDLARAGLTGSVRRAGSSLTLEFPNAELDDSLQMRLDVTDFATPVRFVNVFEQDGNVRVVANVEGEYDYLAFQRGGEYILSVTPVVAAAQAANQFPYTGERISLNFQDIDVRAVLQILADFNDFSLVVSDTVVGNITIRLQDVPWDQALDLVLRARALDSRLVGNVLYVAPAAEIAEFELQELQSEQQAATLAPLVTEYIPINYAVASDLLGLLTGGGGQGAEGAQGSGGILSERGRATVDQRTNTLIIQDVESNIAQVRDMIERLDVPVRQVLIEARIVNASTNFSKALGIRWGGAYTSDSSDPILVGGSMNTTSDLSIGIAEFNRAVAEAVAGGTPLSEALAITEGPVIDIGDALVVDMGVESPTSSFALGILGNDGLLQLELSALEASGNGEVIAQPKVATQDKQIARIESGLQIPYQSQAGGTAGGSITQFIPAVLSLEVTPQITPDNRIIMQLDIHQDSVVPGSGAVPAISTNAVNTRVLVNDGQTVVLGGVFREETTTTVTKTPVLGDIPYLGNLFKRTDNAETKTELLIFITPSIIEDVR